ncbi:hypothetical protein QR680_019109 [Steinernema hermaphroditum]|uniref:Uncharacterized protein n=1 Tax=Steinernema hermaphroditum TaxID=289476 RepID=A0AA39HM51_9BILA|nr:hypothetical protein QR680_019109 [Steinernema hermaphroditum]
MKSGWGQSGERVRRSRTLLEDPLCVDNLALREGKSGIPYRPDYLVVAKENSDLPNLEREQYHGIEYRKTKKEVFHRKHEAINNVEHTKNYWQEIETKRFSSDDSELRRKVSI